VRGVNAAERVNSVAGCVLLILGLVAAPAHPSTATRGPRAGEAAHALRRTNVVVARGAASAVVAVPERVRIWHPWFDPDAPDFRIRNGSDFAAFALVRLERGSPTSTVLMGGRLPEDGLSAPFLLGTNLPPNDFTGYYEVPPGLYRLHLIAKGQARLTLSLDELRGGTRFSLDAPSQYEMATPTAFPDTGPVRNLYSAGATGTLESRGIQFQVYWSRDRAHVVSEHGFCWYDGIPPDETTAYLPPCPFADSQQLVGLMLVSAGEAISVSAGLRALRPPGRNGMGAWFASGAAVDEVGHLALWLGAD
jgi:hypothetical protein